jgi:hypothetical protein
MKCAPLASSCTSRRPSRRDHSAPVELELIIEEVMLAGHVVHVEARLGDDSVGIVEFGRLEGMRDIAV